MSTVTDSDKAHPTHQALIATVKRLLDTKDEQELTVEEILAESGVSTGSLYHHFGGLRDLIDEAMIAQCAEITDRLVAAVDRLTSAASDGPSLSALLRRHMVNIHSPSEHRARQIRIRALARATRNERFRTMLARENARNVAAVAEIVGALKARGLFNQDVDPMAVAVFSLSYNTGLIVNDLADESVEAAALVSLHASFYDNVVIAD